MEPAASIIAKFGGNSEVKKILGVHRSRVASWQRDKASGGTDGKIPFKHVPKLLAAAQRMDIPLTAGDFLPVEVDA